MSIKKIGFIGIGNMGTPMASHLVKAGFDLTVYDVRPETVSLFVERHGGKAARSLRELALGAEAVITMLPDDKVVREVILGDDGVADDVNGGAIVIVPHVLTREYATGMALGFIAKDVKIAQDTARSMEAFAPLAQKVSELWSAAAEKLGPHVDQTEIVRYWEEASGVKL